MAQFSKLAFPDAELYLGGAHPMFLDCMATHGILLSIGLRSETSCEVGKGIPYIDVYNHSIKI